ncbi:MAG TPA: MobF family relaxase [Acidimicrobiia bacterium]|nr:MobF family relaxase [Acidimicrobiia bacterium]
MQSIGKLVASQAEYYTQQLRHSVGEDVPVLRGERKPSQVDYYASHESPSRWMGGGMERLGLESGSEVDSEVFTKLMGHQTPGGDSMVRRFASHGKVAAFDHTFSAPKSVSLLYAFGDERVRVEVTAAHQAAVADAMSYMEEHCSHSRLATKHRDAEGRWKVNTRTAESEGYVAAAFDHFTSRANDPQVHTHVVVINRVWADEGWRAIDAKRAYAHAKAGGSVYQAVLRDVLTQRLGVSWQPVVNGVADIAGFSPELVRHFSTRRTEIVEAVKRYLAEVGGEAHRRVWQSFTLETRQPKSHPTGEAEVTREMKDYGITSDVVAHWQRRAMDAPEDVAAVVRAAVGETRPSRRPEEEQVKAAARSLVEWVSDRQAVFTERDLVAHVSSIFPDGANQVELLATTGELLRAAQESGDVLTILPHAETGLVLPEGVVLSTEELDIAVGQGPGWLQQGGTVRFRALPGEARYTTRLHLEREQRVLDSVKVSSPLAPDREALERAIRIRELVEGQAEAVRHLGELDGRVVAVVGPGGSGKTYSIGAYADAVAAAGCPVIGVATSAAAARQLGEDLGERWTGTIAMLRHQLDASPDPLRPGTLVVVDEASMVSTADLAWLVENVEACHGKLVLVGDPKQLPSVDSGGVFHRIVASGEQVVDELVRVNQRQHLDFDRHALDRFRAGEIEQAVHEYAEAGRLHLGRDEYATKAAMVDAWWTDVQNHGLDGVRMLASRRDEVQMLNQLARVRMRDAAEITGPSIVNRWRIEFQAGDRIVVRDNWYAHADLRNGQTGTVLSVHPDPGSVSFRRDLDGEVIELPKRYLDRNVDHAYAQTIHTSQGQTFQSTHVYADTGVRAEHGYTALSRARGETHLWINDAPGPLGECTYIHGDPLAEDRVASLARQLSQSVIEPLAHDQGLPVTTATDQQLIEWRDELEGIIRRSPIGTDVTDELTAVEAAIDEANEIAERLRTSGARAQVRALVGRRDDLDRHVVTREAWLEQNAGVLHRYAVVADEMQHRINARVAAYEIHPPEEVIEAIGPPPTMDVLRRQQWSSAVARYAEARIKLGPAADVGDPAFVASAQWRDAVSAYDLTNVSGIDLRGPVLHGAMLHR